MPIALSILGAAVCVLLNAFFVLAEFAIIKVRVTRIEQLAQRGVRRAQVTREIVRQTEAYLSATQIGITIASLGLGWLGEPAFAVIFAPIFVKLNLASGAAAQTAGFAAAFVWITLLHVILGELVPKSIAIRRAEASALLVSGPMRLFYTIASPFINLFNTLAEGVLFLLGIAPLKHLDLAHSEEELRIILAASQDVGSIPPQRIFFFENALALAKKHTRHIMTPREKVVFLSVQQDWPQNLELIQATRHTRYPLCDGGIDQTLGMIHVKDLCHQVSSSPDLLRLKRQILKVPASFPAEHLLGEFQRQKTHMAMVTEDDGRVAGMVTLENVLEQLVGNIEDEFDRPRPIDLGRLFHEGVVVLDLKAETKKEAIAALVHALCKAKGLQNEHQIFSSVWGREISFSTGIGNSVALPHSAIAGLTKFMLAFGLSRNGIDFQAPDKQKTHLIFMILSPMEQAGDYLQLLAKLSRLIRNSTIREQIMTTTRKETLLDLFDALDKF
ncbi:MAG: DUF21 domain-containing protein [Elusimicrobia bacterium]|nr:DUF21 domain-containing protein [Elusimicrobiota bacterium]